MSGRGKGKSSKKAVSRSAKAGLQFPVGRIARYDLFMCTLFFTEASIYARANPDSVFPGLGRRKIRPFDEIIKSYHAHALTTNFFPSKTKKQIPQGWQIRHPRWRRRPGLLGRGFGILSG